jgi:hypothetical protein
MKRKLKLIMQTSLILTIGLIMNLQVQAQQNQQRKQQGPPPLPNEQEIEKMLEDLSKTLALSAEQEMKISKLYTSHFEEVKAKTENGRPKREEMESLKSDFVKEVKGLLDDEQKVKFDKFVQEKQKHRGQKK